MGRKTPQVNGDSYSGFNLILYTPEELPYPTGNSEVCPGEEDYCIAYTTGYFYRWEIIEGQAYARFIGDTTNPCVTVEFTNHTYEPQQVVLRVHVRDKISDFMYRPPCLIRMPRTNGC